VSRNISHSVLKGPSGRHVGADAVWLHGGFDDRYN
jgi:hypothetical protein